MDLLKVDDKEARLNDDLLRTVAALARQEGGIDEALRKLRKLAAGTADEAVESAIQAVLDELGIPTEKLRQRLEQFGEVLDLLAKPLAEVEEHPPVELPVDTGSKKSTSGGNLAIEGQGSLTATLEADSDGEALDGRIEFEDDETLLRFAVEGVLRGRLAHESNLGSGAAGIGVETGASLLLENFFRHRRDQRVLDALLEDLASVRLPGDVDAAVDLRHRVEVDPAGHRLCVPDQWIHLEATGSVAVNGRLTAATGSVRSFRVRKKGLDLDETVTVTAGLAAAGTFSQTLEGRFDVLVSHAAHPGQLRVEIAKTNASERQLGLEVGASLGIEGLDGVAKSVLDGFLPKVTEIVERAETEVGSLPNLKKLFSARVEEEVDALLDGNQDLLKEIQLLGQVLGLDLDLNKRLIDLVTEAGLDVAGDELAAIDQKVDQLKKVVAELAKKYRQALKRLQEILQKAAKVKVGLGIAYRRQRSRGRQALLTFRIDPEEQPRRLRELFLGKVQPALDAWERREPGIVLEDGLLVENGRVGVSTHFQLDLAGFVYNHARILTQEWESRVSPTTGDVTLTSRTELTGRTRFISGRVRTLTFLADAEVLAVLGEASALVGPSVQQTLMLTLTEELKTTTHKELRKRERVWREIGILPPSSHLEGQLLAATGEAKLQGPLTLTAALDLDAESLARLAATPADSVRRVFAETMIGTVSEHGGQLARKLGDQPLLLDPGVQVFLRKFDRRELSLKTETFKPVPNWSTRLTQHLYARWGYLKAFSATVDHLGESTGSLAGLDKDAALARIRRQQRQLMKEADKLVTGELFGDGGLAYAFFEAVAILAKGGAQEAAVIVEYGGKTLVLAAPAS